MKDPIDKLIEDLEAKQEKANWQRLDETDQKILDLAYGIRAMRETIRIVDLRTRGSMRIGAPQ